MDNDNDITKLDQHPKKSPLEKSLIIIFVILLIAVCAILLNHEKANRLVAERTPNAIASNTIDLNAFVGSFEPTKTKQMSVTPSFTPTMTQALRNEEKVATANAIYATVEQYGSATAIDPLTIPTQFFIQCDHFFVRDISLSPNGEWFAVNCGYHQDKKLVVQNKSGQKWEVRTIDYEGISVSKQFDNGYISILAWSPGSSSMFFSTYLPGGCGGGPHYCYVLGNTKGLFRLDLATGSVKEIIHPSYYSQQYLVEFSHSGQFYAINQDGLKIVDIDSSTPVTITSRKTFSVAWSPDDRYLAYAIAVCDEDQFMALSSGVYIYDTISTQSIEVKKVEAQMLTINGWQNNNSMLFSSFGPSPDKYIEIYFNYNLEQEFSNITGTSTPYPEN
jgi:hypothetical protein